MRLVPDRGVLPRLSGLVAGPLAATGQEDQQRQQEDERQRDADEDEDGLGDVHGRQPTGTGQPITCRPPTTRGADVPRAAPPPAGRTVRAVSPRPPGARRAWTRWAARRASSAAARSPPAAR